VASPGAGLGSVNPCATMAIRRAWAWVSRVMSRGTSALYGRGGTAAEEGAQSTHTVLTFEVEHITDEVRDLEGRGVGFLDYDTPEIKTVDHVCVMGDEKAAWFADSEGNILCLHERQIGDMRY
jgi:hypothetical protein